MSIKKLIKIIQEEIQPKGVYEIISKTESFPLRNGKSLIVLQKGDKFKITKILKFHELQMNQMNSANYVAMVVDAKNANYGDSFIISDFNLSKYKKC